MLQVWLDPQRSLDGAPPSGHAHRAKLDVTSRLTAKFVQSCQRKCIAVNGELPIVEFEIPAVPQL